jgi:hypothetical protein
MAIRSTSISTTTDLTIVLYVRLAQGWTDEGIVDRFLLGCGLAGGYQCFGGTYHLHFQGEVTETSVFIVVAVLAHTMNSYCEIEV